MGAGGRVFEGAISGFGEPVGGVWGSGVCGVWRWSSGCLSRAWAAGLDLGAPVNIVRMGEGLGQGGSVTRGRGCLNCGLFEGNLGDYGGRMGRLLATKGA